MLVSTYLQYLCHFVALFLYHSVVSTQQYTKLYSVVFITLCFYTGQVCVAMMQQYRAT
jgi:hypothetical protein